jgi:hypothetical protein
VSDDPVVAKGLAVANPIEAVVAQYLSVADLLEPIGPKVAVADLLEALAAHFLALNVADLLALDPLRPDAVHAVLSAIGLDHGVSAMATIDGREALLRSALHARLTGAATAFEALHALAAAALHLHALAAAAASLEPATARHRALGLIVLVPAAVSARLCARRCGDGQGSNARSQEKPGHEKSPFKSTFKRAVWKLVPPPIDAACHFGPLG